MKKILLAFLVAGLLSACGGNESKTKTEEPKTVDITKDPAYQKGMELEAQNDCKTCHTIDDKLTGPPFRDIANKYAGYPDTIVTHLADKVRSGGSGVWGQIMMTPHPGLSQSDAEAIVHYILLLKNKNS